MPCEPITTADGFSAIICTRGPRRKPVTCYICGAAEGGYLCDWPANGTTCSKSLCASCRVNVDRKDYCPSHVSARQEALL